MVQWLNRIRPPARLSSPPTDPSAAICVVGVWIRAQGSGITLWVKRSSPPCAGRHSGDSPSSPPSALRLARIASPVNRRLSALCRVALPFHCDVVTRYGCPIVAGEVATTVDTNSCAPVTPCPSDRRASPLKFPAAALASYKLSPPPAPQGHQPPSHQESLAIVHQ